ncbi:MAG: T9SS type A sorting domain-containing protein [Chitinophagaceae bacterium]
MRRILPILSIILLIAIQSQAQNSRSIPTSDVQDRIVKLYPNPATTYITFDLQKNYRSGLNITVYNGVLGKKVYESVNTPSKLTVDLSDFNRGVYIYHVIDQSGRIIESGKFQVSR